MTASFDPTEERGLMDSRALPRRGQIPVAVEIAVPAELAAKFCFGFGKCGELGFGVPCRWRLIAFGVLEKEHRGVGVAEAAAAEQDAQALADVETGDAVPTEQLEWANRAAGGVGTLRPTTALNKSPLWPKPAHVRAHMKAGSRERIYLVAPRIG
jgi:hypothetical protein